MYQIVITGRLLKGAERAKVEAELTRMFKATPQQVAWLLRGKPIVVKSCEDLALAQRYESALIRAGLECELHSDQPLKAPAAAPAPQQLPMPGVAAPKPRAEKPPPAKPAPAPARPAPPARPPAARRPPTLGPVTGAITAQDRAPEFVARQPSPVVAPVSVSRPPRSDALRVGLIMVGAALAGALGYFITEQFAGQREPAARTAPSATDTTSSPSDSAAAAPAGETAAPAKPLTPAQLILGRWECFENNSGRAVQNEFLPDGRYRSLTYGRADAFMQVEQLDVLVEGDYHLDGSRVTLHVQRVPSRAQFGQPERVDDYLFWDIQKLTPHVLTWRERRLQHNGETCLRSVSLPPPALSG